MKTNLRFICFLAIAFLFFRIVTTAQESVVLNGRSFVKVDSAWHIEYLGERFKVDETSITVKWKHGVDSADIDAFLTKLGAVVVRSNILGYVDLRIPRRGDFIPMLTRFITSDLVEIAEANSFGRLLTGPPPPAPQFPNDPYQTDQWYLNQTNDVDIDVNEAWGYTTGSPSVVVAVLDNGVDWRHEDIGRGSDNYQNVWLNPGEDAWSDPNDPTTGNHIDDDGNEYVDDWKGWNFYTGTNSTDAQSGDHGTFIAGIIAGKLNNNKGIAGIAGGWNGPGVRIMSVVISSGFLVSSEYQDDAILYAVNRGARVINMSFWVTPGAALNAALDYAYDNGCVLFACAGNASGEVCEVWYPANYPKVIAVSGMEKDVTPFSGLHYTPSGVLSISAPAGSNLANPPDSIKKIFSTKPRNTYGYILGGTSLAAP